MTSQESSKSVESKYHTVRIHNDLKELEPRSSSSPPRSASSYWKAKICPHQSWSYDNKQEQCKCQVLSYVENGQITEQAYGNPLFHCILQAYNNHEGVVLNPDDIWFVVCAQFSKYVNGNSENLRSLLVSHEGKKKLSVTTGNQTSESQWEEFFTLILEAIAKNTKAEIVDVLKANFTTTGVVESMLSTATIMDSLKKYFSYGRCIPCCGIRDAHFMGTLDDWKLVLAKTEKLSAYAKVEGGESWGQYIKAVTPIIKGFINTYQGNVDTDWWDKVMNITHGRIGSGSTTYYSGWALHLFGIYGRSEGGPDNASIDVPVEIDNHLTGQQKEVRIVGGFGGLRKEGKAWRPQQSFIVYWDGKPLSQQRQEEEQKKNQPPELNMHDFD